MFIEFINSLTLLFTLALLQGFVRRKYEGSKVKEQFISGIMFGGIAIIAMTTSVQLNPGIIFDPRSVIISLAWIFSGPLAAVLSAAIAIAYRLWLGGNGALTGVIVICLCALAGGGYCYVKKRYHFSSKAWHFLIYGLLVHIAILFCFFILLPIELIEKVLIPFLLLFSLATFFTAFILRNTEHQLRTEDELRQSSEKITQQAYYDELTGLPNRNLFIDRLQQLIKQSHRNHKQIAVLFIDLDRFKSINESLGHDLGDEMLKKVSERLKKSVREADSIARFGGDEFAVIVSDIVDIDTVENVITSIIEKISEPLSINEHQLYITASIGLSIYPIDGETPGVLLRNADSAMYKAKDNGRNTFQYYTKEMTSKAFEHILMESSLQHALSHHEFTLHYQQYYCSVAVSLIN